MEFTRTNSPLNIGAFPPKVRIVKPAETAVARKRLCKHARWLSSRHVMGTKDTHAAIEQLLEEVFSVRSVPRLHNEDQRKTKPSAWGYNRATLFHGDINTGTWPSRLGEARIWDSKLSSWVLRDLDLRMTALARPSSNYKRQTHPLIREDVT
jgi:hypothetical protein